MYKSILVILLLILLVNVTAFNFDFHSFNSFGPNNIQLTASISRATFILLPWNILIGSQNSGRLNLVCPLNDNFCTGEVLFAINRRTSQESVFSAHLILQNQNGQETEVLLGNNHMVGRVMPFRERVAVQQDNFVSWRIKVCMVNANTCYNSRISNQVVIN